MYRFVLFILAISSYVRRNTKTSRKTRLLLSCVILFSIYSVLFNIRKYRQEAICTRSFCGVVKRNYTPSITFSVYTHTHTHTHTNTHTHAYSKLYSFFDARYFFFTFSFIVYCTLIMSSKVEQITLRAK